MQATRHPGIPTRVGSLVLAWVLLVTPALAQAQPGLDSAREAAPPRAKIQLPGLVDARAFAARGLETAGSIAAGTLGAATSIAGAGLGITGQLVTSTAAEIGGASAQVVEDATGGKFLWVASPARSALMAMPQVHTAIRNSQAARENLRKERAAAAQPRSWAQRLRPGALPGFQPVRPTKQVVARQFASPFKPSNMLFTLGMATAGGLIQAALDDEVGFDQAFDFAKDKQFWGGMLGSGIGYGVASLAALALFPVGGTLLPTLVPMIAGTVGSVLGWTIGSKLAGGATLSEALEEVSLGGIFGKSLGAAAGVVGGVTLGAVLPGTLGLIAAPVGAVAGALLLRNLGERWGNEADEQTQEAARQLLVPLDARYQAVYRSLVAALERGDRQAAAEHMATLQDAAEQDRRAVALSQGE